MEEQMKLLWSNIKEEMEKQNNKQMQILTETITKTLDEHLVPFRLENEALKKEVETLRSKINYLELEGRKNNIILHGVEERETNNSELTNMVLGLLNRTNNKAQNETHEWDKWEISKLYRVGKKTVNKIRPIKITLTLTWRRNEILKNKKNFPKGTYITEDLPKEEVEIRKSLIPALKDARASGKYAIIRNGRLIIKDKLEKEKRKRIPSSPPSTPP
ncbi:hypothetical protein MSG28_007274 [Choristoneura fumiferana]|uniref:Uncharacterized protein n=1 Tax=Choristoneura fumiferana TaxID=7141 RepID=A0ACC0JWH6_CHOFU|nr:hypothetical protein MSG28_007274 [Choristoneura fumiferana]